MEVLSEKIASALKSCGISDVKTMVPLASLTSFRIGGPAAVAAVLHSDEQAEAVVSLALREGIPYILLGNGTNVLAPDEGYAGLVLRLGAQEPAFDGCRIRCGAGGSLTALAKESVRRGLGGLEALSGIPGTLGGACAMNAGAYGAQLSDVLTEVRVLRGGRVETVRVTEGMLGYRKSPFCAPECIVLGASLLLHEDAESELRMADYARRRREKQPLSLPSAGSVFRRPEGHFAGALIEQCGLKGLAVGGAEVSRLHAGFIVNRGGATCADVCALIERIQQTVLERTGVVLEREIKLLCEL